MKTIRSALLISRITTNSSSEWRFVRSHSSSSAATLKENEFPRLQALRAQLQQDQQKQPPIIHVSRTTGSREPVKQQQQPRERNTTPQPVDAVQLREWMDQLPSPDSAAILLDTYGRFHNYLRISVVERCNLRCTYCMPAEGVPLSDNLLSTTEILQLAEHFVSRGVTKFRLTGGEPTLRKDLTQLITGLNLLQPASIGMTTNGVILTRKLDEFVDAGLTSINISLDTLQADKFERLTRRPYFHKVWESLVQANDKALQNQNLQVKLNCVVMRGVNDMEVPDFIRLAEEQLPHVQMRFIEYMPFSKNGWDWSHCVPYQELLKDTDLTFVPSTDPSDTTKWYQTASNKRVGFITSMSEHFCASCNRIRLTADGQLKVCLFDGHEVNLKHVLRAADFHEDDLDKVIYHALQHKQKQLGGHDDPSSIRVDQNRPMTLIGG